MTCITSGYVSIELFVFQFQGINVACLRFIYFLLSVDHLHEFYLNHTFLDCIFRSLISFIILAASTFCTIILIRSYSWIDGDNSLTFLLSLSNLISMPLPPEVLLMCISLFPSNFVDFSPRFPST